jgi:hypothetical protein
LIRVERNLMSGGARAGAGRKATPIDLIGLEKLCAMHCSDEEIAGWFGVSVRTIQNRRKQPKFGDVMRRGKAKGGISIRRAQMQMVEDGSVPMAVWLGKNMLGQRDTVAGARSLSPIETDPGAMSIVDRLNAARDRLALHQRAQDLRNASEQKLP